MSKMMRTLMRGLATTSLENNVKTETNRLEKTLTKFWKHVEVNRSRDGRQLTIELDGKPVRTPLGHRLEVPADKQQLAHLVGFEWANLTSTQIKPHHVPLTSLVSRVVDLERANSSTSGDAELVAKVGRKSDIVEVLLRYLDTDTLLVFSPRAEYEGRLRQDQEKRYRPIIADVERFLGRYREDGAGPVQLTYLDSDTDGLRGNKQPEATKRAAQRFLESLDYWQLVAFEKVVLHCKSFICGLLVLNAKAHVGAADIHPVSLEDIAQAASLEIIHQTDKWGEVEDTHDVDYQDIRRNINSAALIVFQKRK